MNLQAMSLHTFHLFLVLYAGYRYHSLPWYTQRHQRTALVWFDIRSAAAWTHVIPWEWLWNERENRYA